ncbi:MAG: hypothetical protein QM733_16880 [Ilumatobacteraceae bacterium]
MTFEPGGVSFLDGHFERADDAARGKHLARLQRPAVPLVEPVRGRVLQRIDDPRRGVAEGSLVHGVTERAGDGRSDTEVHLGDERAEQVGIGPLAPAVSAQPIDRDRVHVRLERLAGHAALS